MGRIKAKYPTGKFILKNRKKDKDEVVTVYLRYIVNSEPVFISTGVRVSENDWDDKKQSVRTKNRNSARLNNQLNKFKDDIDAQIMSYEGRLTAYIVRQIMKGEYTPVKKDPRKEDFIEYALARNQQRHEHDIAYSTYENANYYIRQFAEFIHNELELENLYLSELTVDIFERYKSYCLRRNNGKETINKKLVPLFKAVEYAANNEIIPYRLYTNVKELYFELKDKAYKDEVGDEDVHYLTDEQLQKLVDVYWKLKYPRTRDFLDMFFFAYHACGLRVSDVLTLEWKHINFQSRELIKNYVKGNVYNRIPLTDAAFAILNKWHKKTATQRFVFGLLHKNFDTRNAENLRKTILSKNRTIRTSLQSVGEKIGLPFNLTMHVARHSFAVAALNRGVSIHMISRLMAHASITTTEKVYAQFLQSTINQQVIELLSFEHLPSLDN